MYCVFQIGRSSEDSCRSLGCDAIGPDTWTRACEHVEKVVEQTKANDFSIDQQTEETLIINLADDSNSGSDDADKST